MTDETTPKKVEKKDNPLLAYMKESGKTFEEVAAETYAEHGENLPAFTPAEAECSLTPDEMEDKRLVTVIKGIGPPPRLKQMPNDPYCNMSKKLGPEQKAWFCKFMTEMPSPSLAAKILGCSKNALYWHKKKDAGFSAAWDAAKEVGMLQIDDAITEEALGFGVRHHVTKDGDILTIPKERNEKILLAYLNLHNTERLNKHVVEHQGGGVIMIPQPLTAEEFEKVAFAQQQRHREGHVVDGQFSQVKGEEKLPHHYSGDKSDDAPVTGGQVGIESKSHRADTLAVNLGREAVEGSLKKPAKVTSRG